MNKEKLDTVQFSLSLPESVHLLIPRYDSSRHLFGSIRCKMQAERVHLPQLLKQQPQIASSYCLKIRTIYVTRSHDPTWQPITTGERSQINATSHLTYPYQVFTRKYTRQLLINPLGFALWFIDNCLMYFRLTPCRGKLTIT